MPQRILLDPIRVRKNNSFLGIPFLGKARTSVLKAISVYPKSGGINNEWYIKRNDGDTFTIGLSKKLARFGFQDEMEISKDEFKYFPESMIECYITTNFEATKQSLANRDISVEIPFMLPKELFKTPKFLDFGILASGFIGGASGGILEFLRAGLEKEKLLEKGTDIPPWNIFGDYSIRGIIAGSIGFPVLYCIVKNICMAISNFQDKTIIDSALKTNFHIKESLVKVQADELPTISDTDLLEYMIEHSNFRLYYDGYLSVIGPVTEFENTQLNNIFSQSRTRKFIDRLFDPFVGTRIIELPKDIEPNHSWRRLLLQGSDRFKYSKEQNAVIFTAGTEEELSQLRTSFKSSKGSKTADKLFLSSQKIVNKIIGSIRNIEKDEIKVAFIASLGIDKINTLLKSTDYTDLFEFRVMNKIVNLLSQNLSPSQIAIRLAADKDISITDEDANKTFERARNLAIDHCAEASDVAKLICNYLPKSGFQGKSYDSEDIKKAWEIIKSQPNSKRHQILVEIISRNSELFDAM